jgi:hypothetical protein
MPSPISATDLATARAAVESLMTETVTIKRPTITSSSSGGQKPTLPAGTSSVCRKRDLPSNEQETANQLEPVKLTEFLFPYNTDVRSEDVLVHSEGNFEVIEPPEKRSTLVQIRVLARKAQA